MDDETTKYAGFWRRVIAVFIDSYVVGFMALTGVAVWSHTTVRKYKANVKTDVFPEILVMLKNALLLPEKLALPSTQSASVILESVAVFEPLLSARLVPLPSFIL